MAKVEVRLFATVREAAGTSHLEMDASTLGELLEGLSQRFGHEMARLVSLADEGSDGLVVLVNGKNSRLDRDGNLQLRDGDDVALFPPVSGG